MNKIISSRLLRVLIMFLLDYEEFLQIFNISDEILKSLSSSFLNNVPVDSFIHEKMLQIFNLYLIIGGMPNAVWTYKNSNNVDTVIKVHKVIVEEYKKDFTKYEEEYPLLLNEKASLFKLFLNDVGLLTTLYTKETKLKI